MDFSKWTRAETSKMTYTKDQLDFTTFHVWYKLAAVSLEMLSRLKDERMTGFKMSWSIKNPTLIANISEVGRGIQTPGFAGTLEVGGGGDAERENKVILTLPEGFIRKVGNGSLVIELDADVGKAYKKWKPVAVG